MTTENRAFVGTASATLFLSAAVPLLTLTTFSLTTLGDCAWITGNSEVILADPVARGE
jgi:hypothetical protein